MAADRSAADGSAVPAAPRLEIDDLLVQLVDRAHEVLATQGRLRVLLRANRAVVSDLDLPAVLRRIVEVACELLQARYGALGVISPAGGLEQFVHHGMEPADADRIAHLPEGKGLLGALIDDPHPIRLTRIAGDQRSIGFPAHHPPMATFLGVPIVIRGAAYGNLYLTDRIDGGAFTAEDEELALALATTAAAAIDNARLYEDSRRRQDWLRASTELTRQLLVGDSGDPLTLIAERVAHLAGADLVTVVLPAGEPGRLVVQVATGRGAAGLTGLRLDAESTLPGRAIALGLPMLLDDATLQDEYTVHLGTAMDVGPVMAIPLIGQQGPRGALVVGRVPGRRRFSDIDMDLATSFANTATIALELADARADQQRVALLEDRDRIARDLHDHVIQRLFASGLSLQSVAAHVGSPQQTAKLAGIVDDLDVTIRQIRATIFQLRGPLAPAAPELREQLAQVAAEFEPALGFPAAVAVQGPLESIADDGIVADLLAVAREGLSNAARHARAGSASLLATVNDSSIVLEVRDDGVGAAGAARSSGLANLRQRAEARGGTLALLDGPGTHLRWSIPRR